MVFFFLFIIILNLITIKYGFEVNIHCCFSWFSQTVTTTTTTPTTIPTTPTTSTTTPLVFGSGISPTGSGTTGINDSSATLPLITRGHYPVLFSGPDPLVSVAAGLIILHLVQKKMCGQDVTMIEPRLVIWNHLEAIPTKEFFFIFFFPVVFLLCGKKKKKEGRY